MTEGLKVSFMTAEWSRALLSNLLKASAQGEVRGGCGIGWIHAGVSKICDLTALTEKWNELLQVFF